MSSQENINSDSSPDSPTTNKATKDALFEPKPKPKMIRVLTVLAYVLSVSMAAILLSIYYIFMWDGRPHIGARTMDIEFRDSSSDSRMGPKFLNYKAPMEINDYMNNVDIIDDSSLLDEVTYNATLYSRNETVDFSQNNLQNETYTEGSSVNDVRGLQTIKTTSIENNDGHIDCLNALQQQSAVQNEVNLQHYHVFIVKGK